VFRLNLIPAKLERKASMPECTMRVVPESEEDGHRYGPSEQQPVNDVNIGQKLRIEWSLQPTTGACARTRSHAVRMQTRTASLCAIAPSRIRYRA
jgi:hypothetical protein